MLIFVDFVGLLGDYKSSSSPSWIHPTMPVEVITGPVFLDAQLGSDAATDRFLYHVEFGELIKVSRLLDSKVKPLDTLVVVNNDDPLYVDPETLDRLWAKDGGALRRLAHSGMPATQRTALTRYAH